LLFKEQFMRLTHAVAGFELADADLMRRALGKKHEDEIEYWGARFADAAVHHGVDRGTSRQIVEHLEMFSGYLFSEACALAMATLSLRMATFKTHAPAEFARAVRAYREGG
jgi:DNA polymerase-3 subunit alpha